MRIKQRLSWRHHFALATTTALVLSQAATANVVGSDTQNFNPVSGRTDFVTVQSSNVLEPGRFSLGLFLNSAINTLPYRDGNSGQNRGRINDTLTSLDAGFGYGLMRDLELALTLPFVVHQTVRDDKTRGEFEERGNIGARVAAKWNFLKRGDTGFAAIGSINTPRTADDPYAGVGAGPTYNLEVAADHKLGLLKIGGNLGLRLRTPGKQVEGSLVEPVHNQLLASVAAALPLLPGGTLVGEIYGSRAAKNGDNETDRSSSNAESLIGWRHIVGEGLTAHAGFGSEWMQGLSTPDWRIYVGLVSEFGPKNTSAARKHKKTQSKPAVNNAAVENYANAPAEPLTDSMAQIPNEAPDEVFILRNINFEFDSDSRVLPGAFNELDKLANYLKGRPYSKIVVEGHTDFKGSDEYNDNLSARRAQTVRRHLIKKHGMDASRIVSVGYGERRPLTNDTSDYGRQQNRRVELKIYRD